MARFSGLGQVADIKVTLDSEMPVGFDPQSTVALVWTNATTTDVTPDTDTEIDVSQAKSIYILCDSTDSNNTSTDTDINVISSFDGTTYEDGVNGIYVSINIGDDDKVAFLVEPGPQKIKLRLDENDANRADVTATVYVRN